MLRLGNTHLFICSRDASPRLGRSDALALLERYLADEPTLYALRALLGSLRPAGPVTALNNQQVVEELATRIGNGELILFAESLPRMSGGASRGTGGGATSRIPPRRPPAAPPPAAPIQADPSLFPKNADLAAMAASMQAAAQSGAPLCEH